MVAGGKRLPEDFQVAFNLLLKYLFLHTNRLAAAGIGDTNQCGRQQSILVICVAERGIGGSYSELTKTSTALARLP